MRKLLIGFLVMLLIAMTPQVYAESVATATTGHENVQVGANETNGSAYVQGMANKIKLLLGIIGGAAIGVMWLIVGLEFFSSNPQKKADAKEHALYAGIGTIIVAAAVGGGMWLLARWIAGA